MKVIPVLPRYTDMFINNMAYPAWSKYLIQLLKEYQVEDGLGSLWNGKYDPVSLLKGYQYTSAWTILEDMSRLPVQTC